MLGFLLVLFVGSVAEADAQRATPRPKAVPAAPANSSPIVLSRDGRLVWSVNPEDDSVSVIRTSNNRLIRTIKVGDEPQGVALDPLGRYAYAANAAGGSLTVIRITDPRPGNFRARLDGRFGRRGQIATGAEPWNVVASPDGRRVFVANSGQDTISVIDVAGRRQIGRVDLARSVCNLPDRSRHFQPRGLAVTANSKRLYVTRFLSFVRPGGRQADDAGREGIVCRIDINTAAPRIAGYVPARAIPLAPQVTGFKIDATGDTVPDDTSAFPNQLQSVVIWKGRAYLPNVAASPSGPLRFNVDTQAFVNVINGIDRGNQADAGFPKGINLNLGARDPIPGEKRLFFSNLWAIAFSQNGGEGPIYGDGRGDAAWVVSAGSDLLVKANVDRTGELSNTVDGDTTSYIDLNDPADPATSGARAGKNPQGIVINRAGTRAYVANFVSRNVSVVDLRGGRVVTTVQTDALPRPGSPQEIVQVGAEVFFSSRGSFDRPPGTTVSTTDRLSSEGWQSCASCHFKGLTDGVVWQFPDGPRKSIPLNGTFNPRNRADQRALNYTPVRDEVEDFELNARNVSGPGPLLTPQACANPAPAMPATSVLDPNHGLLISDTGNLNLAPCTINNFALKNADRRQVTVTLPGSSVSVPALTAMREWVRFAVRSHNGPVAAPNRRAADARDVAAGRRLFVAAGCQSCHGGGKWTASTIDFAPPPAAAEIATERTPLAPGTNPVGSQYLSRFLRDIGSFNLGVPGGPNPIGANVGGVEKAAPAVVMGALVSQDALGIDYNGDGKGNGFNVPSLLGINAVPPYYHNGACETLACVLTNARHRTANGTRPDVLVSPRSQAQVVRFLQSITARTQPVP